MLSSIKLSAPAKVNLFLEVTGKRPDGYHELATLFAKIELADTIYIRKAKKPGVSLKIINKSGCKLSAGQDNLVSRAVVAVIAAYKIKEGVSITLTKRIPIGAGLGGGSSDAGAALRGMCALFNLTETPWKDAKIRKIARGLGADVPVFLYKEGFLLGRGIGDRLTPLRVRGPLPYMTLVYPGEPVSTAEVYRRLVLPPRRGVLTNLRSLSKLKLLLEGGGSLSDWKNLLFNRLEEAVLPYHKTVRLSRVELVTWGAQAAMMSGSGSCVFALSESRSRARQLAGLVKGEGRNVFATCFTRGSCYADKRDTHPPDA
ncbi:MAG: 4-(cytidine 5'-diphospho)-2-C-methyl-D-erythritol kinase [Elusimicrobiales bacterium]|nr:4-(cytidine 5'-diphospho)-2-C-methyl-D-erythritol kinase [Elusimicrobiales bacterium]